MQTSGFTLIFATFYNKVAIFTLKVAAVSQKLSRSCHFSSQVDSCLWRSGFESAHSTWSGLLDHERRF